MTPDAITYLVDHHTRAASWCERQADDVARLPAENDTVRSDNIRRAAELKKKSAWHREASALIGSMEQGCA
ncbi:MAG: hypothetical protein V1929_00140 [bacterium]